MDSDNFAADRETQAETVFLCCVERVEETLLVRGVNAYAGIRNRCEDTIAARLCTGGQDAAPSLDFRHSLDCVADEVEDQLLKVYAVRLDIGQ